MINHFLELLRKQRNVYVFAQMYLRTQAGKDIEADFIKEVIGQEIEEMLIMADNAETKLLIALGVYDL